MNAVRQKVRPRHQILILKCYPKFQKNVAEVKPNSSELSYLLYYASTRRSKLQKVGAFLEKKSANDVSKSKIGCARMILSLIASCDMLTMPSDIQVTLQILKALIEKLPRELPLYASFILHIIKSILDSKDLTIVEDSIAVFEAFCKHYDLTTLAADQAYIDLYEQVVKTYASYAALKTPIQPKGGLNASVAVRWRTAGLKAIKSITASDALGADAGRQLDIILPVILQNLQSGDDGYLLALQQKAQTADTTEREQAMRRRMSIATVQTGEALSRPTSASVMGNVDDADRLAEEEVGILAIQSLKQVYTANNRAQIRLATTALLAFICAEVPHPRPQTSRSVKSGSSSSTWGTILIETVTKWTLVQDRFVILVTIMETLVRSPVMEENLEQQLSLVSLVRCLLRSSINMIGLSVMDVLLGLVQHILLLLQLGGRGSNLLPHHQQTDAIDLFRGTEDLLDKRKSGEAEDDPVSQELVPSSNRQELLLRLQKCIGDLAIHVYYSDQISDIISTILLRLKPSTLSSVPTTAAAIEHPQAAVQAIAISGQLHENPQTNEFFSFGTARVTALRAIEEVLTVANPKGSVSGAGAIGRNRVNVQVWEGTQWLLRDDDRRVRRAYVEALLTWLRLEMSSSDLRVWEDKRKLIRTPSKMDIGIGKRDTTAKKGTSNATQSEPSKPIKSTFLQLLHLAVYDNAIESSEAEDDLLLLHLILNSLVEKLGVNAVKTGLPMILRLQEDINTLGAISTPTSKIKIGSLCHGYLWSLCEKFDLDTSTVGYVIQSEISRRKKHGLWLTAVQVPPLPLERISTATVRAFSEKGALPDFEKENIKPFDARSDLVDKIAEAYSKNLISPPTSPPASPGRVFSMPILSSSGPSGPQQQNEMPVKIKEAMLSEWSKEICISTVESEVARTSSLHGSRRGVSASQRRATNGQGRKTDSPIDNGSPVPPKGSSDNEISPQPNALSLVFGSQRRMSAAEETGSATPISTSDRNITLRVDDLKRVLAGGAPTNIRNSSPLRYSTARHDPRQETSNSQQHETSRSHRHSAPSSDSVVSAEGFESVDEGEHSHAQSPPVPNPLTENHVKETAPSVPPNKSTPSSTGHSRNTSSTHPRSRPHSGYSEPATPRSLRRPSTSSSAANEDPEVNAAALRGELPRLSSDVSDEVPPVPPLPAGVAPVPRPLSGGALPTGGPLSLPSLDKLDKGTARSSEENKVLEEREKERHPRRSSRNRGLDVKALLGSIDAIAGEKPGRVGLGRPPY